LVTNVRAEARSRRNESGVIGICNVWRPMGPDAP
jgi:hypothetical protein